MSYNKNLKYMIVFILFLFNGCERKQDFQSVGDGSKSQGKASTQAITRDGDIDKSQDKSISKKTPQHGIEGYSSLEIDAKRIQNLGVSLGKVKVRDLVKKIRTVGIVEVDERLIAHIQTKFTGWIEELYVDFVGMPVKLGQPLFKVYSQELFSTQEEFLLALKDLDNPVKGKFASEFRKSSIDLFNATKKRLELWDITPEQILLLEKNKKSTKTLIFRSPLDGIVLAKTGFFGMNVAPGINTYTIADLSYIWVLADVYEDDISFIHLGQKAQVIVPAIQDETKGKVTFIDYVVDMSTRTTKVRFEFENPDFLLKPGMYTTVEFDLEMGEHLALPEEALIDTGERKIVFVSKGEGRFEPRDLKLGFKAGEFYQLLEGLEDGDMVVTSAQFLFDSESRLKALDQIGPRRF